jgi:chorismate dehydratase
MATSQKIIMVNYLNSKPFEYGLLHHEVQSGFEIIATTPAHCATLFANKSSDIALVPVGALHELTDYKIITDFCIGCDGEVRTVCIFSNQKLEDCNRLLQDTHSRTSVLLSKLITEEFLHLKLSYHPLDIAAYEVQEGDAVLMIGDKVFDYEKKFKYKYDLGSLWKEWTGLPFVFAVWIARVDKIDNITIQNLNQSFEYGIAHLPDVIKKESNQILDLYYYFSNNIQYVLDEKKRLALDLFLEKSAGLNLSIT